MNKIDRDDLKSFIAESSQRFARIAPDLQALGKGARPDQELVSRLFRETHSLKAAANLLDLKPVEQIAHTLEDLLDMMRNGSHVQSEGLVTILIFGFGRIKHLMEHVHLLSMIDVKAELAALECKIAALKGV